MRAVVEPTRSEAHIARSTPLRAMHERQEFVACAHLLAGTAAAMVVLCTSTQRAQSVLDAAEQAAAPTTTKPKEDAQQ